MKIKLETEGIENHFFVTESPDCKTLRYIYRWTYTNRLLLRIYEFKTKTIVIASQLIGGILWDELLMTRVIREFELKLKNLTWINHIGLFSDFKSREEQFIKTIFLWKKPLLFSPKQCDLVEEKRISLEAVENLIESRLEPVEDWLVLAPEIQKIREAEHQEKKQKLLRFYLIKNLDFLAEQKEVRELLLQELSGAIFFYPEKTENQTKFLKSSDLEKSNNELEKLALIYQEKCHLDDEIVVCVYIEGSYSYCTIISKNLFLESISFYNSLSTSNNQTLPKNSFNAWQLYSQEEKKLNIVEDLIEIELELAETKQEVDISLSRQSKLQKQKELEKLLQLYLQSNLESLILEFEQWKLLEFEQWKLINQSISEFDNPIRGALFYYPRHEYREFCQPKQFSSIAQKLAMPYVNKYNVENEVVICVCLNDHQSICGIFPKTSPSSVVNN